MKIGIDVSPLRSQTKLAHRVRGVGFYIERLLSSLQEFGRNITVVPFLREEELPSDVGIVHYPYFEPFSLTPPRRRERKMIITIHDLTPIVFPKSFPPGIKGSITWHIQRLKSKRFDHILCDSLASRSDVLRLMPVSKQNVSTVYLAADSVFTPNASAGERVKVREKYQLPKQFVLYVGDVTWNKNLPRLLDSIEGIDTTLVMVGKALTATDFDRTNPWNQDQVIVEEKIKNNPQIKMLGFVPVEDLVVLYNLATVFSMPSLYEGFGLPVLEAMSSGVPVVTSERGSLKEVAGDASYVVNPESVEDIRSGIARVLADKALQNTLKQKGIKQAARFSWKHTAEATARVYEEVSHAR